MNQRSYILKKTTICCLCFLRCTCRYQHKLYIFRRSSHPPASLPGPKIFSPRPCHYDELKIHLQNERCCHFCRNTSITGSEELEASVKLSLACIRLATRGCWPPQSVSKKHGWMRRQHCSPRQLVRGRCARKGASITL